MPVSGFYGVLFFLLGETHTAFHAVLNAGAVADDQGRSRIGFCFPDGFQGLVGIGAHGYLGYVDIAVTHGH